VSPSRHTIAIVTCALAIATFAVVQDRVTAAGARHYAAMSRDAVARRTAGVTIESVMAPAIRSSVQWGAASAGLVLLVGLGAAWRRRQAFVSDVRRGPAA
jgi:hypothetical protein